MVTEVSLDISHIPTAIFSGHLKLGGANPQGRSLEFTSYYMLRNGKPFIPVMGEFHFSRYRHQFWEEELLKIKAGGIDIVATYVFWNHIEEEEGVFDWSGNRDLRQFIQLCGKHHLERAGSDWSICTWGVPQWWASRLDVWTSF